MGTDELGRIYRRRVCGTCGKWFDTVVTTPLKRRVKPKQMGRGRRLVYYCCADCMAQSYGENSARYRAENLDLEARAKTEERRYLKEKQKYEAREAKKKKEKSGLNSRPVRKANICFDCQRACGDCSWSRKFEPVPGWTAEPMRLGDHERNGAPVMTYCITECPLFVADERKGGSPGTIEDDAFQELLERWGIR